MLATQDHVFTSGPDAARSIRAITRQEADACEANRTLTSTMVDALWDSGLMTYLNVPEAGGYRADVRRGDGDVDRTGLAGRFARVDRHRQLPVHHGGFGVPARRRIRGAVRRSDSAGHRRRPVLPATAPATRVDGGYLLTGSWNFGSGTGHSEYVACGFFPIVDGEPLFDLTQFRAAVVPR